MKFNESDMAKLISEVETEFHAHLAKTEKKEETVLAKSEEVDATEKEQKATEVAYDQEDIAEMNEMYSSMSKSEVTAHYEAICGLFVKEETEIKKSEDSSESVLLKSELFKKEEETDLLKSELATIKTQLEGSSKENEELKKNVEKLVGAMGKFISAPKRKAVTSLEGVGFIKKSEAETAPEKEVNLSHDQIIKKLTEKVRSGDLKKGEDELINQFCYRKIGVEKIKHLL